MTLVLKYVYIDKLDGIVNKCNNTYHSNIKMKTVDSNIDFGIKNNDKDPKFKVADHARISKYTNIFANGYTPNWSNEDFVIKKVKNAAPWTYLISDLNGKEITGMFHVKEFQQANQKEFKVEKVIK